MTGAEKRTRVFCMRNFTSYLPESKGAESRTGWFPAAGDWRRGSSEGKEVKEETENKM